MGKHGGVTGHTDTEGPRPATVRDSDSGGLLGDSDVPKKFLRQRPPQLTEWVQEVNAVRVASRIPRSV